jgi:hypothetical protein
MRKNNIYSIFFILFIILVIFQTSSPIGAEESDVTITSPSNLSEFTEFHTIKFEWNSPRSGSSWRVLRSIDAGSLYVDSLDGSYSINSLSPGFHTFSVMIQKKVSVCFGWYGCYSYWSLKDTDTIIVEVVRETIEWEDATWNIYRHPSATVSKPIFAKDQLFPLKFTKSANEHAQARTTLPVPARPDFSLEVEFYGDSVGSWSWAPVLKIVNPSSGAYAFIKKEAGSYARWGVNGYLSPETYGKMNQDTWYKMKIQVLNIDTTNAQILLSIRDKSNNGPWVSLYNGYPWAGKTIEGNFDIYLGTDRLDDYYSPGSSETYYYDDIKLNGKSLDTPYEYCCNGDKYYGSATPHYEDDTYDNLAVTHGVRLSGLNSEYGESIRSSTDRTDVGLYINLQTHLNPDRDYYDENKLFDWYKYYFLKIDTFEITVSIKAPDGYLSGGDVRGNNEPVVLLTDFSKRDNSLDDTIVYFFENTIPFLASKATGYDISNIVNYINDVGVDRSESDQFTSISNTNSYTWKWDYGTTDERHVASSSYGESSNGKDDLSIQIRFIPDYGNLEGEYTVTVSYKIKVVADFFKANCDLLNLVEHCRNDYAVIEGDGFTKEYIESFKFLRINI